VDQLLGLFLLGYIACEMNKETPSGPGIVEDNGGHIDPDALAGASFCTHVKIRNLNLLPSKLHHAASFVAYARSERASPLQYEKAGLVPDLFWR
jgi:hypothetical protein